MSLDRLFGRRRLKGPGFGLFGSVFLSMLRCWLSRSPFCLSEQT